MRKGKFFVFEGIDGAGKSTQSKLLTEYFVKKGYAVEKIDFPQHGERSAAMVDDYLTGKYGDLNHVSPYAASIFFASDRFGASFKIKKWLQEGKIVISDRYTVSNVGHLGGEILRRQSKKEWKKYVDWLYNLEYGIFGIPKPDYTFILKISPEFSFKLANAIKDKQKQERRKAYLGSSKKQDIHEEDKNHLKFALESYESVAKKFPKDFKVIECLDGGKLLAPEVINQKIVKLVEKKI